MELNLKITKFIYLPLGFLITEKNPHMDLLMEHVPKRTRFLFFGPTPKTCLLLTNVINEQHWPFKESNSYFPYKQTTKMSTMLGARLF